MIYVDIDELTPCLQDVDTGELIDTEVLRIRRKSFLRKFTKKQGWYVNWESLADQAEIYALVLKGTVSIQGLIAIRKDENTSTVFIDWAVASPENNKQFFEKKKYVGVGGHRYAASLSDFH